MKLVIALSTALLPVLAAAADPQDAVLLSFERDLVRETAVQAIRPALAEEDALAAAIRVALHGNAEGAAGQAARYCAAGRQRRGG